VEQRRRALARVVSTPDASFWARTRVLVTGHTGFKGAWLCHMLAALGAEVTGVALDPGAPSAFAALGIARHLRADHRIEIRDAAALRDAVRAARPEVVFHLAAQALVGAGYRDPVGTFATNVDGTVHLLESLRGLDGVRCAVIVTSDKVYRNDNAGRAFTEADALGGTDPYSASKAAAEIAVASWRASFPGALPPIATARAGNVIGGGDFGEERLIPDLVRAQIAGTPLQLRRPDATRPFQHVQDVLRGYLLLAERLVQNPACPRAVNFGPRDGELSVRRLLDLWGEATGTAVDWQALAAPPMEEARRLALDSTLASRAFGWQPELDTPATVAATARWYAAWRKGEDMAA
jgi:CDP-glucose 4,6-dehydratase